MHRPRPRRSSALLAARSVAAGLAILCLSLAALVVLTQAAGPHLEVAATPIDDVAGVVAVATLAATPEAPPVPSVPSPPVSLALVAEPTRYAITIPGLSTGVPDPPPPPIPAAFLALEASLADTIAGFPQPAQLAIAVTDLQTGHTIAVNGDRPQLSGCVINLFVILEALRMVQAGNLALADVDSWIYATTWSSNASTAQVLYSITGAGDTHEGVRRAGDLIASLGLSSGTVLDHPPAFPSLSLGLDPNNWITARDINLGLAALYTGTVLDPAHTAYALDALATVKAGLNYLTAARVPAGVIVSHKNGFLPTTAGFVDNDAGIVRFQRNGREHAYAVTFLSQDTPHKYGELPVAQDMMALIWAYFDAAYPAIQ